MYNSLINSYKLINWHEIHKYKLCWTTVYMHTYIYAEKKSNWYHFVVYNYPVMKTHVCLLITKELE